MLEALSRLAAGLAFVAVLTGTASAEMIYDRGNTSEPESLDPHKVSTVNEANILRDLFEGLVMPDAKANLIPGCGGKLDIVRRRHGLHLQAARRGRLVQWRPRHRRRLRLFLPTPRGSGDGGRIRFDALRHQKRRGGEYRRSAAGGDRSARDRCENPGGHPRRADAVFSGNAHAPGDLSGEPGIGRDVRSRRHEARQPRFERRLHARRMGAERSHHAPQESALPRRGERDARCRELLSDGGRFRPR